jgi:hypothetical protein
MKCYLGLWSGTTQLILMLNAAIKVVFIQFSSLLPSLIQTPGWAFTFSLYMGSGTWKGRISLEICDKANSNYTIIRKMKEELRVRKMTMSCKWRSKKINFCVPEIHKKKGSKVRDIKVKTLKIKAQSKESHCVCLMLFIVSNRYKKIVVFRQAIGKNKFWRKSTVF